MAFSAAVVAPTDSRHIVLAGPPASGKSTVGARLAQHLGLPFIDTDAELTRRTGRTISELFSAEGEGAFRRLERGLMVELLDRAQPAVIATGGGTLLERELRHRVLRECFVISLATPLGDLVRRPRR